MPIHSPATEMLDIPSAGSVKNVPVTYKSNNSQIIEKAFSKKNFFFSVINAFIIIASIIKQHVLLNFL